MQIILEQQVSLASARAAYGRLEGLIGPATAARVLELDDVGLRSVGFSRQKAGYVRALARAIVDGELDPAGLGSLEDEAVRLELIKRKGIGAWSADIYLLMALGRADIWPRGDLALGHSPEGKALKFVHRGSYDDLDNTYEAITNYLDDKRLEAKDMFIEEYVTDPTTTDAKKLVVNVYVVLKPGQASPG